MEEKKLFNFRFDLPFKEAVDFLKSKGDKITFDWEEMTKEAHDRAFTVAKMQDMELLKVVHAAVIDAVQNGITAQEFEKRIKPILQEKGWWGRKEVLNEETGKTEEVQLGSPRRLRTIFRTNMKTAYAAGKYKQIQDTKAVFPYLMYDAVDDDRTRDEHAAWDGLVLPVDDDWWKTHYPPNGWNCRCSVIQMNDRMLAREGKDGPDETPSDSYVWTDPETGEQTTIEPYTWENPSTKVVEEIPGGIDPGWNYAPGASLVDEANNLLDEKAAQTEDELGLPKGSIDTKPSDESNDNETPFEPSTTIEDAIRFAKKEIAEKVIGEEIPLDVWNAINQEFVEIIKKHSLPKIAMIIPTASETAFASVGSDGTLKVNSEKILEIIDQFGSLDKYFQFLFKEKELSTDSLNGALAHEAAHYFEVKTFGEKQNKILERAFKNAESRNQLLSISKRAAKNKLELYAEVQAMLKYGEEVPKEILEDLKEILP